MKKYKSIFILLGSALCLQACGTSILIKQEATETVAVGRSTILEVNKYYDYVFERQNLLAASLLARYTECNFGDSIVVRRIYKDPDGQNKNPSTKENAGGICFSDSELKMLQQKNMKVDGDVVALVPIELASIKSSMDIVGAFSIYLDLISSYTVAPTTPVLSSLNEVINELTVVQKKIDFLPKGTDLTLAQASAVGDFLRYSQNIFLVKNDADKLRMLIESDGAIQERNLLAVAGQMDSVLQTYVSSMGSTLAIVMGDYYNKNKSGKDFDSLEKRQNFLVSLFKQKQLNEQIKLSSSSGAKAIRLFVAAHEKLRNAVTGNYTKEQRDFIIQESMRELKERLQNLASVAKFAISLGL